VFRRWAGWAVIHNSGLCLNEMTRPNFLGFILSDDIGYYEFKIKQ
jgi:hypothetical protein